MADKKEYESIPNTEHEIKDMITQYIKYTPEEEPLVNAISQLIWSKNQLVLPEQKYNIYGKILKCKEDENECDLCRYSESSDGVLPCKGCLQRIGEYHYYEPVDGSENDKYLILSGEGDHEHEHQFCMELDSPEEANVEFTKFKKGAYKGTYLFIYKARKIREE